MGFWDVEDNEPIKADGTYEKGGGDFELIPAGTTLLACIEEVKWKSFEGEDSIAIRWSALQPDAFKNRKVFQTLKVNNSEAKKRDKDKRMLAAIDANAKGGLFSSGEEPTDMSMTKALVGKPMLISIQIWEMNDRKGNWVNRVAPKGSGEPKTGSGPQKSSPLGDEIPF